MPIRAFVDMTQIFTVAIDPGLQRVQLTRANILYEFLAPLPFTETLVPPLEE